MNDVLTIEQQRDIIIEQRHGWAVQHARLVFQRDATIVIDPDADTAGFDEQIVPLATAIDYASDRLAAL